MQYSVFCHIKPFGLGSTINMCKDKGLINNGCFARSAKYQEAFFFDRGQYNIPYKRNEEGGIFTLFMPIPEF